MPGSFWNSIVSTHLDAPIDQHFGEPVTITPMIRSPNGRSSVDPDRSVVRATAIFTRRPHRPGIEHGNRSIGGRGGNQMRSLVEGDMPKLSVPDGAFAPGARPRQGDRVEVAGERYEVVSARHDGVSRFNLDLIAIGG
jgi:hypothetical protein